MNKDERSTSTSNLKAKKKDKILQIGDYIVGEKLGEGTFGRVMKGTHYLTNKKVALKLIDVKNPKTKASIDREAKIMKLLDHPNIVHLYEIIEMLEKHTTVLALEYIEGGELFDYIISKGRLSEDEAIKFFRQMISAIEYCHANFVVHRDLKPENVLLDNSKNVKIMDFGLSNTMKTGSFLHTNCGSTIYCAPEILQGIDYIGPEVDVWSLGCILYVMVTGCCPWAGRGLTEQIMRAVAGQYEPPENELTTDCWNLISRVLTVDAKKRPTISELRNHPWVNRGYTSPPLSCLPEARPIASHIDKDIVKQLVGLGFEQNEVINDVLSNKKVKQGYNLYYLMLDKKEKAIQELNNPRKLLRKTSSLGDVKDLKNWSQKQFSETKKETRSVDVESAELKSVPLAKEESHSAVASFLHLFVPGKKKQEEEPVTRTRSGTMHLSMDMFKSKKGEDKLKTLKSVPSGDKVSSKTIEEIIVEIEKILAKTQGVWKKKGYAKYIIKELKQYPNLKVEMEVCRIEKMGGLKGIKFKRAAGDLFDYKSVVRRLCDDLQI